MYTLYTFPTPNARRASIMLEELGQSYEVKSLDLTKGEQLQPDFLKINPLGKVPALVDDDGDDHVRHIFGSQSILLYLAEHHEALLPRVPGERTETLNWLSLATTDLGPNGVNIYYFTVRTPMPEAAERFITENRRMLKAMDQRLAQVPYLAGPHYTIADIAAFPFIAAIAASSPDVIRALPALQKWFETIAARPAVKRGMAVPA